MIKKKFVDADNINLSDEQDAMEFGVYTDGFDVIFDEEELPDSDDEQDQETQQEATSNMTKNLTQKQREDIYQDLLWHSSNGKLKRSSTTLIAAKYGVHVRTIQRVWQRAKKMYGTRHTNRCQINET
jgi:hypothetical protein